MRTKLLIVISSIFITACSSSPKLVNYNSVEKLDRQELINGINDCRDNDLKPYVSYTVVRLQNSSKILVPVDVFCQPIRK
jgi:uncharacterized protein YcfL